MTSDPTLLDSIYRRPEFVWAGWMEALQDWLYRLLSVTFAEGSVVQWVAFGLVIAAVAVGLFLWLRRRQPRRTATEQRLASPAAAPDRAALEGQAQRLAMAGDWAGAVRSLLQAFVVLLDSTGVLAHDPARTNRELRRRLRPMRTLEPALDELLGAAESVTYAGQPGDAALWQTALAAYRQLAEWVPREAGK